MLSVFTRTAAVVGVALLVAGCELNTAPRNVTTTPAPQPTTVVAPAAPPPQSSTVVVKPAQ